MIPIWVYVFPLAIMARTTSVWLTVAIAAQRWIAVTFPLKVISHPSTFTKYNLLVCVILEMGSKSGKPQVMHLLIQHPWIAEIPAPIGPLSINMIHQ